MKIENQVCTLEQAKEIERLGVISPCAFYWHFDSGMKWRLLPEGYFGFNEEGVEWHCAFNAAELSLMLESEMPTWIALWSEWGYKEYSTPPAPRAFQFLAVAAADKLIYLLKSGRTTAAEIIARLTND